MDIYNAEPKKQQGETGLSLVIGSLDSAVDAQGGAPHSLADKSPHSDVDMSAARIYFAREF